MNGIAGYLQLGWDALLLRRDDYEHMPGMANPVVKGLILIVVVGVVFSRLRFGGDVPESATLPNLMAIKCRTIDQMKLVNTLCWVKEYSVSMTTAKSKTPT